MPEPKAFYLFEFLLDVGVFQETGMAVSALSWQEIIAWQAQIGVSLQAWEVRAIRHLSREYVAQMDKAKKPEYPMPYGLVKHDKIEVAKHIKNILRG